MTIVTQVTDIFEDGIRSSVSQLTVHCTPPDQSDVCVNPSALWKASVIDMEVG